MHFPPKFLQKPSPPTFSMVHLLHRLYGENAPAAMEQIPRSTGRISSYPCKTRRLCVCVCVCVCP